MGREKHVRKLEAEDGTLDRTPQGAAANAPAAFPPPTAIRQMGMTISGDTPATVGLYPIAEVRPIAYCTYSTHRTQGQKRRYSSDIQGRV